MIDSRTWRHFDWILLVAVALLVGYGVTMIYSATHNIEDTRVGEPSLVSCCLRSSAWPL